MTALDITVQDQLSYLDGPARDGQRRWTQLGHNHITLPIGYRIDDWEVEAYVECKRMLAWRRY